MSAARTVTRMPAAASRAATTAAAARVGGVFSVNIDKVVPATPKTGAHRAGGTAGVGLTLAAGTDDVAAVGVADVASGLTLADALGEGEGEGNSGRRPVGSTDSPSSKSSVGCRAPVPRALAMRVRVVVSIQAASTLRTPGTASRAAAGPFVPTASTTEARPKVLTS